MISSQLFDRTLKALDAFANDIEEKTWLRLLLLVSFVPLGLIEAHGRLLNADELYTWHIARAPSIRSMLALAREVDLHPPLSYLLERYCLDLPGPRWLVARLPSLLAGLGAMIATFAWIRRYLGSLMGCCAVALFSLSTAFDFSWQNRPYMIWFASAVCLIAYWCHCFHRPTSLRSTLVLAGLSLCTVLTHVFAVFCLYPVVFAEVIRAVRTQRPRWAYLLALLLPSTSSLLVLYQVQHFGGGPIPEVFQASFSSLVDSYSYALGGVLLPACAACAFVALTSPRDLRLLRNNHHGSRYHP